MTRPLSQLTYAHIQDGDGSPRIITLHNHNQHGRDVDAYGQAAGPNSRVIGLESYKGVYSGREVTGYTWFVGPQWQPSPLFFGDALAEIERFLWDEIDRQKTDEPELPFLLGVGQGAIMAIAAAAAVPDLLSGAIAVEGFLPKVSGWDPPLERLAGLPILLLDAEQPSSRRKDERVLEGEHLALTLESWGGNVTRATIPASSIPAAEMSAWLTKQSSRTRMIPIPGE